MLRHKRDFHGEEQFECGFAGCDKTFGDAAGRKEHWKRHLGQEISKIGTAAGSVQDEGQSDA